jgi:hypothetical protein
MIIVHSYQLLIFSEAVLSDSPRPPFVRLETCPSPSESMVVPVTSALTVSDEIDDALERLALPVMS